MSPRDVHGRGVPIPALSLLGCSLFPNDEGAMPSGSNPFVRGT
jgi:hypothetical protein